MLQLRSRADYRLAVEDASDAIKAARVICIFFMTYVHVHLFTSVDLAASPQYQLATSIIRDVLGRASVPLLSVVSGFLLVGYLSRRSLKQVVANRSTTLLMPVITWNLIGIVVFSVLGWLDGIGMNDLFPLLDHGFQHHLTFLRDLFVVSVLSPVLIWALKRAPAFTVIAIILVAAFIDTWPIILRTQILLYFTLGLLFGLYRLETFPIYKASKQIAYIAFCILLVQVALNGTKPLNKHFEFTTWVMQPISVLTFWGLAQWVTTKPALMGITRVLEPAIFLFYLSHFVAALIISGIYAQLEFAHTPWIYTTVWVVIPVMCLLAALAGRWVMHRLPDMLSVVVIGKA